MIARNLIASRRPAALAPNGNSRLPDFRPGFISDILSGQDAVADVRDKAGNLHVSALSGMCPRAHVLALRDGLQRDATPRSAMRVVWAMGRGIEKHVREQLLAAMNWQHVLGEWSCRCGALKYEGVHIVGQVCAVCKQPARTYGELALIDGPNAIEGHPDFLFYQSRSIVPLEIKSMNKADFLKLTEPKPDNVFQLGAYHRLLALKYDVPISNVGIILYVSKDFDYQTFPYKEFHVRLLDEHWLQSSLDVAWGKAGEVQKALRTGELPFRLPACINPHVTKARNCPACVGCFSRP